MGKHNDLMQNPGIQTEKNELNILIIQKRMHVFPAPGCGQEHTLYIYMYVHECMLFKLYTCTLKYKKNSTNSED